MCAGSARAVLSVLDTLRRPELAEPEPQPSELLEVGCSVSVYGLTGAPQHDGKNGTVQGYDAAKGRYSVRVEGEAKGLRIKTGQSADLR